MKTYYRFADLLDCRTFSSLDLAKKYGIKLRSANGWLRNKEQEGYVVRSNPKHVPIEWGLTDKARELALSIIRWKEEFINLGLDPNNDSNKILESLKRKA